jgi:hypothetical protein
MKILAKMMYKLLFLISFMAASSLLVSGCTTKSSNEFGEEKYAPDEFAVYSRAPLSIPPNFGLRPPKPGVTRPQTIITRNQAKEALLSNSSTSPLNKSAGYSTEPENNQTPGIAALLKNTGATQAKQNIRALVNSETAGLSSGADGGVAEKILFWRKNDTGQKGAVINPATEQRRMRRTAAEGDVVEEDSSPTIQRPDDAKNTARNKNEKSFWGSLFD